MRFMHKFRLLIIFFAVFVVHVNSKVISSSDSRWFIPTSISILHHRDVDLNEYAERIDKEQHYAIQRSAGNYYNVFPIGTSIISLPIVWVIDVTLDRITGISLEERFKASGSENIERFIASIFVAIATVLVFLIAEKRASSRLTPYLIASIFAFATPAWSTASRALWQHGPSMMLLSASLYFLLKARESPVHLIWPAPLLAAAYVVRPTNSLSFALLMGITFLRFKTNRYFWYGILLAIVLFGCFLAFNIRVHGALLPYYYQSSRLSFGPTFAEALVGNLISPNRGLFVFTPVLLFSLYGVFLKLRHKSFDVLDATLIAIILLHWVVISALPHWWGGYSIGPRFFTDMIPYFVYFLIPVVDCCLRPNGIRQIIMVFLFAVSIAISFYIHQRSANNWRVIAWNYIPNSVDQNPSRVWDWRDLQFRRNRANTVLPDEVP